MNITAIRQACIEAWIEALFNGVKYTPVKFAPGGKFSYYSKFVGCWIPM